MYNSVDIEKKPGMTEFQTSSAPLFAALEDHSLKYTLNSLMG